MQAVDTQGVEPMAHAQELAQRLRPDRVTEESTNSPGVPPSRRSRRKPRPASTSCRRSSNDRASVSPTRAGPGQPKEISSVELTRIYLDRIARINPQLNAFITVDPERSLAQAQRCRRAAGAGREAAH
jgi:hypothetical protein